MQTENPASTFPRQPQWGPQPAWTETAPAKSVGAGDLMLLTNQSHTAGDFSQEPPLPRTFQLIARPTPDVTRSPEEPLAPFLYLQQAVCPSCLSGFPNQCLFQAKLDFCPLG